MSANLSIRALIKRYDGGVEDAVAGFDLEVGAGEFVTLLGPSGSGKTTILKMIAGFERPTSGQIVIGDRPITDLPVHRRGIGMVFQNYALFPHLTVAENVAFPLSVRDLDRDEIESKVSAALSLIRLDGLAERYPMQLSGGQQQRVALARAVVFDPTLLLMDEPLGALDRNLRESMKYEIKQIQNKLGMTVIYVTHDQDEALAMSDRICVMQKGRLVQIGTARELYDHPVNRFAAQFIGESNLLSGTWSPEQTGATFVFAGERIPVANVPPNFPALCSLMIRPERIRVTERQAKQPGPCLDGEVSEVTFLGESTRYGIKVADTMLTVKQQNADDHFFPVGSRVSLIWQPNAAKLLPE